MQDKTLLLIPDKADEELLNAITDIKPEEKILVSNIITVESEVRTFVLDHTIKYGVIFLLSTLFGLTNSAAQTTAPCDTIYKWADTMPVYRKGNKDILDYISQELTLVVSKCMTRDSNFITSLYLVLTINHRGEVIDVQFTRPCLSPLCQDDLRKKLLTMQGWTSGKMQGVDVCTYSPIAVSCFKWD
jgi:hypothetical protein